MTDPTNDVERRLAELLARRADVYSQKRERNPYYGDADIDLLRAVIVRLTQGRDEAIEDRGMRRREVQEVTGETPTIDEKIAAIREALRLVGTSPGGTSVWADRLHAVLSDLEVRKSDDQFQR